MRLHTNLTELDLWNALRKAVSDGHITADVWFDPIEAHGSSTHPRAFEIQLGASNGGNLPAGYVNQYNKRQKCRRVRNAANPELRFSATWHEWGWFLAEIFEMDPTARVGGKKNPVYNGRDDFDCKTHYQFEL